MASTNTQAKQLQRSIKSLVNIHLLYTVAFSALIFASRAWNLIPLSVAWQRSAVAIIMICTILTVWRFSRDSSRDPLYYQGLVSVLIGLDIFVATFMVFTQRGIASRGLFLYAMALATAAQLKSRFAIVVTTLASIVLYGFAVLAYAHLHPSENYKVELYGELAFYAVMLVIYASLIWLAVRPKR